MKTPSDASPLAETTALVVLEAVPLVMRAVRARMREGRPAGVTVPQFRALLFIRRHPGAALSDVAEHLGTSVPAASDLVSRLVREALVVREADPRSRRRVSLTLTAEGRGQLESAERRVSGWLADELARLSPEQLAVVAAGLEDLRALFAGSEEPDEADRAG